MTVVHKCNRVNAEVREFVSRQCVRCSFLGLCIIWVEFVVGPYHVLKVWVRRFCSFLKNHHCVAIFWRISLKIRFENLLKFYGATCLQDCQYVTESLEGIHEGLVYVLIDTLCTNLTFNQSFRCETICLLMSCYSLKPASCFSTGKCVFIWRDFTRSALK